jgi:protein SCO1/2
MRSNGRSLTVRLAAIGLAIACVVVVLVRLLIPSGPPAPDFTLTDQNGQPYTLSAHRGHPIALFFGYAHCPDVCPTTLAALAGARRKLGAAGSAFDVVLVTVDPKRDSPAVLKRYVHLFDPAFMGVTGTESQLDPVYAAYHIQHEIDPTKGSANGYTVAHSSVVQFISPGGRLRGTGNFSDSPDELAVLMRQAAS